MSHRDVAIWRRKLVATVSSTHSREECGNQSRQQTDSALHRIIGSGTSHGALRRVHAALGQFFGPIIPSEPDLLDSAGANAGVKAPSQPRLTPLAGRLGRRFLSHTAIVFF